MKYLIIGGTGLISTSITRILLEQGEEVTLYNRGRSPQRFPGGARTLHGDRSQFSEFEAQVREAGEFDCVIDMICYRPEQAESDLRAFDGRCGRFIFCSTVDVYAKPAARLPYTESAPRSGLTDYARNKLLCEEIFSAAHQRGDLPVVIIRPAHTYGEGGPIIHTFGWSTTYLDRIRKGKPVIVAGNGNSLWVSCHIDDVARTFVAAAGSPIAPGRAYHTTGEEWQTWNAYHEKVAEAMGAPAPRLIHIPADLLYKIAPEKADITMWNFQFSNIFDNSAARTDLGFRYTIPWLEGARRTIAWLEENGKIKDSDEDPFDDMVIAAWERLSEDFRKALA
jgi:nucleoside-diphosphate-sugar epimerase